MYSINLKIQMKDFCGDSEVNNLPANHGNAYYWKR